MNQRVKGYVVATAILLSSPYLVQAFQQPSAAGTAPANETQVTGCLRSSATVGVTGEPASVYTLEEKEASNTTAPAPTTGLPSTAASSSRGPASKVVYTLSAPESVGLERHVNHEVQITGGSQRAPAAAGTEPAKPGGAHNTLEVSAVKMISTNCPPATR